MTASYDKSAAVVVLPPVGGGRLSDPSLRSWLARSDMFRDDRPAGVLDTVLGEIGKPCPVEGLAAMRMWGQTGDRPTTWIAAADPVYLEPRLDHLCVHALRKTGVPRSDLRPLMDHLQRTLGKGSGYGFMRLETYGYLSARQAIATSDAPAYAIDGQPPNDHLPQGEDTAATRNLVSEIEMALHDHEVNLERQQNGLEPVNSLWLWGGGIAPEKTTEPHPPLFSDDPLLAGYWQSKTGLAEPWPGSIAGCLEVAVGGFVATTPEFDDDPKLLTRCLEELRSALQVQRLTSLTLLFRDGLRAHVRRAHNLRVWRRRNTLLDGAFGDAAETDR